MTENTLKVSASRYYELGCNIVPVHLEPENPKEHKKPLIQWREFETRRQTEEEFKAIQWDSYANGFGVICGQILSNAEYLAVIDHDVKPPTTSEAIVKGKEILKQFPTTATEETGSKGLHLIYYSRKPVRSITYHDECALELLGEKKLCIMAPSLGYRTFKDNLPTEIEDLEALFYATLEKAGLIVEKETEQLEEIAQNSLFKITKLVDITKLTKIGENEYQGPHPTHDSTTGKNFCVNTATDSWRCFRCDSGGGPLQLLAVLEGRIKCEEAKKGALKGAKYRSIIQLAIAKGLISKEAMVSTAEINPVTLAKNITENFRFVLDSESDKLYYFDVEQGVYSEKTEQLVKREIAKVLDDNARAKYYVDVDFWIRNTAPIINMNTEPELSVCQNGLLNVLTLELKPFSPDYYITTKILMKYDPKASCPKILKFLDQVLDEQSRKLHQEFIGYCLYRKILWHKAILFVGLGSNGKSVLLDVDTALLGRDNVSNQTIQDLCFNRFSVAELHNKLANIAADLPSKIIQHAGHFLMSVAGDRLKGEKKHQDPFYFYPFAKLAFSCNVVPPIANTEDNFAYYRRWIILEFKNTFTGKKDDKQLRDKLRTSDELSGYLNYALAGLKRLMEQQDFSETQTVAETRKAYIKRSNSAKAFIEEKITITDEYTDFIFQDILYREFITYCHNEKIPTQPKALFTKAMQEHCSGAEHSRIRPDKDSNPIAAWRYIKLNSVPTVPTVQGSGISPHEKPLTTYEKNKESVTVGERKSRRGCTAGTPGTEQEQKSSNEKSPPFENGKLSESEQKDPKSPLPQGSNEGRTCGRCVAWHKLSCSYPGAEPSCVSPTNQYAADCPNFILNKAINLADPQKEAQIVALSPPVFNTVCVRCGLWRQLLPWQFSGGNGISWGPICQYCALPLIAELLQSRLPTRFSEVQFQEVLLNIGVCQKESELILGDFQREGTVQKDSSGLFWAAEKQESQP